MPQHMSASCISTSSYPACCISLRGALLGSQGALEMAGVVIGELQLARCRA